MFFCDIFFKADTIVTKKIRNFVGNIGSHQLEDYEESIATGFRCP